MDDGGGLENRFRLLADVGSNPTPSAMYPLFLSYETAHNPWQTPGFAMSRPKTYCP